MSDKLHLDRAHLHALYHQMLRIRRFESRCVELYQAQKIRGFMHLYDGEEAVAVGVLQALRATTGVRVEGLMLLPPFFDEAEQSRPFFRRLRSLAGQASAAGLLAVVFVRVDFAATGRALASADWPRFVLSALPFALLHGPQYAWSWRHLVLITVAGVAFGYARYRSGSTAAAAIVHAAYNTTFFLAFVLYGKDLPEKW